MYHHISLLVIVALSYYNTSLCITCYHMFSFLLVSACCSAQHYFSLFAFCKQFKQHRKQADVKKKPA